MSISLIVAMSDNRVIGNNNQLPWHLPNDLKHFKALTMGKTIVMGRKTYESIGKALPGRRNIVMSSDLNFKAPDCQVVHTMEDLEEIVDFRDSEIMIIGGARLFEQFLERASALYLTQVHAVVRGDVMFPELKGMWKEETRERFEADTEHAFAYSFIKLQKI